MSAARDFSGRIALVTGAAQGIGRAVALQLAQRGARVAAFDQHAAGLDTLSTELHAHAPASRVFALDLRDGRATRQAVQAVQQQLGPIDLLANVAGVLRPGAALDDSAAADAAWADSLAVNTMAVVQVCQTVGRHMRERGRGAIVTVGSNAAATPRLGMAAYAASKAAAAQFMRCLALELAPHGVRCNLVSPGSTDTAMQRALWQGPDDAAQVIAGSAEGYRLGIPLGRLATACDVAEAVCFLLSDAARHITMHDLRVDGGATFDL